MGALVVNGKTISVSGTPNQTVAVPAGQLIVNEQSTAGGAITVNALHLVVPGQADVALASATAGITCEGSIDCTAAGDRITGGGWIAVGKAKANFGVAGGRSGGFLWGHLVYQDPVAKLSVKGTGVTAYAATGTTSRRIEGTADIAGGGHLRGGRLRRRILGQPSPCAFRPATPRRGRWAGAISSST